MENTGFKSMLVHDQKDDLKRLYSLLKKVNGGHIELKTFMATYIRTTALDINEKFGGSGKKMSRSASIHEGQLSNLAVAQDRPSSAVNQLEDEEKIKEKNSDKGDPIKYVEEYLDLRTRFYDVLESCFANDRAFQTEIDNALQYSININPKTPEYVSLFIDENLKKGFKGKSEAEVDALLDSAVTIFKYVNLHIYENRFLKKTCLKGIINSI